MTKVITCRQTVNAVAVSFVCQNSQNITIKDVILFKIILVNVPVITLVQLSKYIYMSKGILMGKRNNRILPG